MVATAVRGAKLNGPSPDPDVERAAIRGPDPIWEAIHDLARQRSALGLAPEGDPVALGRLRDLLSHLEARGGGTAYPWNILGADDIFKTLAPRSYPIKGFAMAPGPPALWLSFSFGGKSVILQDLCLSLATGTRVWGQWACAQQRVLHIDYEQGHEETRDRYQRLARGRRLDAREAKGWLHLVCRPPAFLNSPNAEDAFKRELDGYSFAFLDTFAAALPGVEENEVRIGEYIYLLGRVSEATGCTIAVAHHMGKGSLATKTAKGGEPDLRTLARGSTAIFAAAGYAYALGGAKREPKLVQQAKARGLGDPQLEDFYLELEQVDVREPDHAIGWKGYRNPHNFADVGGFAVRYRTVEQVRPPKAAKEESFEADVQRLLGYIRQENAKGRGVATMSSPAKDLKMRKVDCLDAFKALVGRSVVHGRGRAGASDFWISNPLPLPTAET